LAELCRSTFGVACARHFTFASSQMLRQAVFIESRGRIGSAR
jgi:hypothetical protein